MRRSHTTSARWRCAGVYRGADGLAKTLQALDNLPAAEAAGLRAIQIDANNPKAHALMGGIYSGSPPEQPSGNMTRRCGWTRNATTRARMGHLKMELGQMDGAKNCSCAR